MAKNTVTAETQPADVLTPGGLAVDAQGKHADVPLGTASVITSDLFDVTSLLRASMTEIEEIGGDEVDEDGLSSRSTQVVALLLMADKKVRDAIRTLGSYV